MNDSHGSCQTLPLDGGGTCALLQAMAPGDLGPKVIRRGSEIHLKDSILDIQPRLELYLSDPGVRDAMENGTVGITPGMAKASSTTSMSLTPTSSMAGSAFLSVLNKPTTRSFNRYPRHRQGAKEKDKYH
jgi:hypothetical protein